MVDPAQFCRDIETYLCQKNDGHLVRIVGPAFEQVCGWADRGVPLKVAFRGIDRYFERYYAKGARRRPVRIEFCEADILDAFDDWRRAVGVAAVVESGAEAPETSRRPALASHIERAVQRLRAVEARGSISGHLQETVRAAADELEKLVDNARSARGEKRAALIERLADLDKALLDAAMRRNRCRARGGTDSRSGIGAVPLRCAYGPGRPREGAWRSFSPFGARGAWPTSSDLRVVMPDRGEAIELSIEKPAAGGRMLARHNGKVVFVHGAIPGERVRARLERVERQLSFASVSEILEPSPDRRQPATDLLCGGCTYAHIVYPRQLTLKAELIQEAFARLGKVPLDAAVVVQASPERGYRLKARFHVSAGRVGFYREATHELCDAATTGQLREDSVTAAIASVEAAIAIAPVTSAELSENIAADERVMYLEGQPGEIIPATALEAAMNAGGLTGCSSASAGEERAVGIPVVTDPMPVLTGGRAKSGQLQRHAESFFQANRYLLADLVATVHESVLPEGEVVDLYAGVGLFSISLAHAGREGIVAVEGNRTSVNDLMANASACGQSVRVVFGSVEDFLASSRSDAHTIIVDPPRTGMSRAAMEAVIRAAARRVVYVSCDPPTLARDARRLIDAGYRLSSLRAFDLFPNTPHVETVCVFDRS